MFKDSNVSMFMKTGYIASTDKMPEKQYQAWVHNIIGQCLRVSKGIVWVNHKTRYRDGLGIHPLSFLTFPLYSEIVWNRGFSLALNSRRFAPSHEYFFGFGKPHYWDNAMNTQFSVWDDTIVDRPEHPCPYPETIIEKLISASCPKGGIVFDPFSGSGTTSKVARDMERRYIACDISLEYCELARKRLANTDPYQNSILKTGEKQLSLFASLDHSDK